MAPSVRETIVQAICDALNAAPGKPCFSYRTRIDAFSKNELPAIVVFAIQDHTETAGGNVLLHRCMVRVEILVAGEPPCDSLVDPIHQFVVKTISDETLLDWKAKAIRWIHERGCQWETEASYQEATVAAVDFEVVFATNADDPSVRVDG